MTTCTKCGSSRFNGWGRCMDCRNIRAKKRTERLKANGGSHTNAQWQLLLSGTPFCPECKRVWSEIPNRPDARYQTVWTKDHIIPVIVGGTDDISNIRPLCYECNFRRHTKPINNPPQLEEMKKIRYTVKRGQAIGSILTPHIHEDNHYVVSLTRFEKDYIRVKEESALLEWMAQGFSVRMSNPEIKSHKSPSLISPESIEVLER